MTRTKDHRWRPSLVLTPIGEEELLARFDECIAMLDQGVIFRVLTGEQPFCLGADFPGLFEMYDAAEYGWPTLIDRAAVRSITDLRPRWRHHPMVLQDGHVVAMAISLREFEDYRTAAEGSST